MPILPTWPLWGGEKFHPAQQLSMLGIYRHHITYPKTLKNACSEHHIPRSSTFSCNEVPSILPLAVQNTNYLGPGRSPFAQECSSPPLIMVYREKSYPNCILDICSCWSEAYQSKNQTDSRALSRCAHAHNMFCFLTTENIVIPVHAYNPTQFIA